MGSVAVRIAASLAFEARNTTAARRLGMMMRIAVRLPGEVITFVDSEVSQIRYTSQAAALGGNVASVNGALARMGSPAGSASGRSAALSAHTKPPP